MTEYCEGTAAIRSGTKTWVLGWAVVAGVILGTAAKLLGLVEGPMTMLGQSVAVWVTAGFLLARRAAEDEELVDGAVWATSAMAVYLGTWLLTYTAVYGAQDPGGFGAAWLNERIFFVLLPPSAGAIGLIAALSTREGVVGDMALAAPIAWALPEAVTVALINWQIAVIASAPALALGLVPAIARRRRIGWVAYAVACIGGGAIAFVLLSVVTGRM